MIQLLSPPGWMKDEVIAAIRRFESGEIDFDDTREAIRHLTGKTVDRNDLENYWRGVSLEDFAEDLATPEIEDWDHIDDQQAKILIENALAQPGSAIFLRNARALEKRYRKPDGFLVQLVFHDEVTDGDRILTELKVSTEIQI